MNSCLSRVGSFGLGKAVEFLDTLGSRVTSLNVNGSFFPCSGAKGAKISVLAFEVANTIVKGVNLMLSLSEENIDHLNKVVLPSESVFRLVSKDIEALMMIVAADKREELKVFSGEVVRFGNRCKDPQWHNLGRYFDKLGFEVTSQRRLKADPQEVVQQLMVYAENTVELYHEMLVMSKLEQDFQRKHEEEENLNTLLLQNGLNKQACIVLGKNCFNLSQELKSQERLVNCLKKSSLWGKILDEVMEPLVDMVHILHLEILSAFGCARETSTSMKVFRKHERLGPAGLALHYANIINQIDVLAARFHSVPSSSMRDTLYQALPPHIKSVLPIRLRNLKPEKEYVAPKIKIEMEKILSWLVPVAKNTTRANRGFRWVGQYADTGSEPNQRSPGSANFTRLETLFHADKDITEAYILDLLVLLHRLIFSTNSGNMSLAKSTIQFHISKSKSTAGTSPSSTVR